MVIIYDMVPLWPLFSYNSLVDPSTRTLIKSFVFSLFDHGRIPPPKGGFSFRTCVVVLSQGTNTLGEARLKVLPFNHVIDNISC